MKIFKKIASLTIFALMGLVALGGQHLNNNTVIETAYADAGGSGGCCTCSCSCDSWSVWPQPNYSIGFTGGNCPGSATLSWTVTNADNCVASWTNSLAQFDVVNYSSSRVFDTSKWPIGNYFISLQCSNPDWPIGSVATAQTSLTLEDSPACSCGSGSSATTCSCPAGQTRTPITTTFYSCPSGYDTLIGTTCYGTNYTGCEYNGGGGGSGGGNGNMINSIGIPNVFAACTATTISTAAIPTTKTIYTCQTAAPTVNINFQ